MHNYPWKKTKHWEENESGSKLTCSYVYVTIELLKPPEDVKSHYVWYKANDLP